MEDKPSQQGGSFAQAAGEESSAGVRTKACPSCGTQAPSSAEFCPSCGKSLGGRDLASFGRRLGGYIIDAIIASIIAGIPAFIVSSIILAAAPDIAFTQEQVDEQNQAQLNATIASSVISLVIGFAYIVILNANGGTWGKRILGMRLEDANSGENIGFGPAVARYFIAIASGLALLIGYLWVLWDDDNQTWHDKAAGSVVVVT